MVVAKLTCKWSVVLKRCIQVDLRLQHEACSVEFIRLVCVPEIQMETTTVVCSSTLLMETRGVCLLSWTIYLLTFPVVCNLVLVHQVQRRLYLIVNMRCGRSVPTLTTRNWWILLGSCFSAVVKAQYCTINVLVCVFNRE